VPDWDEDSPRLRQNLARVLEEIVQASQARETPTLKAVKYWHTLVMQGLAVPDTRFVGAFRGEPGLENLQTRIGTNHGVGSAKVARELSRFETKLQTLVAQMDALQPAGQEPDADQLAAIVDLCAWVHAEWVRIHPFANGNGRTARLWANSIAMRYGLPPFIRLRPRPNTGYGDAGAKAMRGDWQATARVFRRLLDDFLNEL
jgi:fido (protein-threonine AMPylation protein)